MAITPRDIPPKSRFVFGMFRNVAEAEHFLTVSKWLSEANQSVMRSSGIILEAQKEESTEIRDYALSVMDDEEVTLQDIADLEAIVAQMKEFDNLDGI